MTPEAQAPRASRTQRRRVALGVGAAMVAGVDLTAKAWAQSALASGGIGEGVVSLRLTYNSGVAFGLGTVLPAGVVVAFTAALTAAIAVLAWRTAAHGRTGQLVALALLLGGALANVIDRAGDGVVTDYLHTGWWPTFNLADVAVVTGALLLALTSVREPAPGHASAPGAEPETKELR